MLKKNKNTKKLATLLYISKDFDFLYKYEFKHLHVINQKYKIGKMVDIWPDIEDFVVQFCSDIIIFPNKIYSDNDIATDDELQSCKNYIVDTLFVGAFIDMFIEKCMSTNKEIEGFIACENNSARVSTASVAFYMQPLPTLVDDPSDEEISIRIALPAYVSNNYKDFSELNTFKNSCKATIEIYNVLFADSVGPVEFNVSELVNLTDILAKLLRDYRKSIRRF